MKKCTIAISLLVAAAYGAHLAREMSVDPGTMRASSPSATASSATMRDWLPPPTLGHAGSYLAARHADASGQEALASYYYSHALHFDPYDGPLMQQALRAHALAGNMREALAVAQKLEALEGGNQLSHLVLYLEAIKTGHQDEAANQLKRIKPYGLFSVIRPLFAGWLATVKGNVPKDIAFRSEGGGPEMFEPFIALQHALMYDIAGETARAAELYDAAAADLASVPYSGLLLIEDFYRRQGETEKAQALLKRYSEENSASFLVQGSTPNDLFQDFKIADKERYVQNAEQGLAELLYAMAGMLYNEELGDETMLYLRLALYLRPDHANALLMLGNALEDQGKEAEAAAVFAKISGSGPLHRRAEVRRALCLDALGQRDEALDILKVLAKAYPKSADVWVTRGDIYRAHGEFEQAAEAYTEAIGLTEAADEQAEWPILFARGISYERTGAWERAEQDLRTALDLSPGQPDVLNYLGYSWLIQGKNIKEAKHLIEQAITERPDDGHIVDSMGWALFLLGDYKASLAYLERAIDLMPHDPTVNDHLGDALWKVGRKNEARYQWERALTFKPEASDRAKIERKLEVGLDNADGPSSLSSAQD